MSLVDEIKDAMGRLNIFGGQRVDTLLEALEDEGFEDEDGCEDEGDEDEE